jgi:putative salt-induced outer membrane protein
MASRARPLLGRECMTLDRPTLLAIFFLTIAAVPALSQPPAAPAATPPKEPPPLWDVQVGGSFVGTSGNSDTASTGADFAAHRRGLVWQIESTATAVRTNTNDATSAERYLAMVRGQRKLTRIIGLSTGEKVERDRFSGIDFRSILDGGFSWALVRRADWTLDGVTSIGWKHDSVCSDGPSGGACANASSRDSPVGVFQLLSRIPFGGAGDTTQRFTYYPDLKATSMYRNEAEVTAQATMTSRLALKLGYLLRYANEPVPGFKKTDSTTTASVVLRWKASVPAPAP